MTSARQPSLVLAIGLPALVFASCIILHFTVAPGAGDLFNKALLADLVITAPLLYWWSIRRSGWSAMSVLRVVVIGTLIGGYLISDPQDPFMHLLRKVVVPVIELVVVAGIIRKLYQLRRQTVHGGDFLVRFRNIAAETFGNRKIGNVLAAEAAVLYYLFRSPYKAEKGVRHFTNYKESGILVTLWAVLFIFTIEAAGMHFLLQLWSHTGAWIITGMSCYTCLQVAAHMRAVKSRAIRISGQQLWLFNGLAGDACIDLANIRCVEQTRKMPADASAIKLALLGTLEPHNIILYLHEPVTITRFLGIRRQSSVVLFHVDQPATFISAMGGAVLST